MITSQTWAGKTYGVYGLARTGRSVADALTASGATVHAWDDGAAARDAWAGKLTDLHAFDPSSLDALVVSPGVPHSAPLFVRASAAGVAVIGDIELFAQARVELPRHKVVGITGTNGKSTTTALIHHILSSAGIPARMGGNIGLPILSQEPLPDGGVYVLELSSFQIEITYSLACEIAVLLNITPDHLDRHGTVAAYAAAKAGLFEMQVASGLAIVERGAEEAFGILDEAEATVEFLDDVTTSDQSAWPALQGPHNAQNAAAATAVCRALGLDEAAIEAGLLTYPGLPHRMERIAEKHGVLYVNDSKATNATSAAPALAAYPSIHWIAGGLAKTDELGACLPHLGNVRAAYLIGDAAPLFGRLLEGHTEVHQAGMLDRAVALAAAAAQPGDTILLSPACASYDQFTDYEARGAAFRAAVEGLA